MGDVVEKEWLCVSREYSITGRANFITFDYYGW